MKRSRCSISGTRSASDHFLRAAETQLPDQGERFACRTGRELVDCLSLQTHMPRNWVQTCAVAFGTGHSFAFIDRLELPLGVQLVLEHRIAGLFVVLLKFLVPDFPETGAHFAPAMRGVEGKQTGIKLFKRSSATRTAHLRAHHREAILGIEEMRGPAADIERALDEVARLQDALRVDHTDDRVDRVLLETFELAKLRDRDQLAIDIKRVEALPLSPARHLGVKTLCAL